MATRGRSLLKSWFRRGVYPKAEQFADWMDSFWHREEDRLPVSAVENLPGLLNDKYARTDGEGLEQRHDELAGNVERKNTENSARFSSINAGITALEEGKADVAHTHVVGDVENLRSELDNKLDSALKGSVNGVAELDGSGKVPSSQLPSYVDDVECYDSLSGFPATGEDGKIYVAKDTNKTYRWGGSVYVVVGTDLALGETSSTAYRGDRGKIAYDYALGQRTIAEVNGLQGILDGKIGNSGNQVITGNERVLTLNSTGETSCLMFKKQNIIKSYIGQGSGSNDDLHMGSYVGNVILYPLPGFKALYHKNGIADEIATVGNIPDSLPAADVYPWAKQSVKPAYTAAEVGAASAGHLHAADQISDTASKVMMTAAERTKLAGIDVSGYMTRAEVMALIPPVLEVFVDADFLSMLSSSTGIGISINGGTRTFFQSYMKFNVTTITSLSFIVGPFSAYYKGVLYDKTPGAPDRNVDTTTYSSLTLDSGQWRGGNIRIMKNKPV